MTHDIVGLNRHYYWELVRVTAKIENWDNPTGRVWTPIFVEVFPYQAIIDKQKLANFSELQFLIGMIEAVNQRCHIAMDEIRRHNQIADPLHELIAQVSI